MSIEVQKISDTQSRDIFATPSTELVFDELDDEDAELFIETIRNAAAQLHSIINSTKIAQHKCSNTKKI